ncbi:porphobilinogen synthase [Deinococcus metallilatus]|uniref:Delta-aminolevulinic acid dehydratase n=1 Tax=Deinococcus metallilatus TaxID=1211322 RepID=A0AAJ5JXG4_9DEIO|nr:porphobilinogen synthase [Deinococcus metallilatus]MBB5295292.1 porphobilinogen synthase [Deinococcus metallilatus]QBY08552.1 porphobilinogen synthase [Deinococcus metallilatus]RXJ10814.1 porphobilinogen synthase [Deinococcus metallilatus]TLK22149.1 porphobilinogen synthase [Deinococcus metallilatus]GMA15067.1 delta-aminolevulinic acid dehydratase [Deinococcus metallilatus]
MLDRPRRLRRTAGLRALMREVTLTPQHFIHPLFVHEQDTELPIATMPGVSRHSVAGAVEQARTARDLGITSVILFGIPDEKDPQGSQAYAEGGVIQRAATAIKAELPDLTVIADTCLCEYTDHGHCGPLCQTQDGDWTVDNDAALELLARTAVSQARAGADVVAPSAMMDGQVAAIRTALDAAGFEHVPVMSYAVKYASAYYGPFRDAAGSAPSVGNRASYQMDPAGGEREALREARLDAAQGADYLMVKPALAYLDILRLLRDSFDLPLVAYNVSGEYALVKAAVQAGYMDERRTVLETLTGMRRAGADAIITYHALDAARWLREG